MVFVSLHPHSRRKLEEKERSAFRMSGPHQLLTKRNKEKLKHDGAMFTFEKNSVDGMAKFWRCDQRNSGCRVRIHTGSFTNQVCTYRTLVLLIYCYY